MNPSVTLETAVSTRADWNRARYWIATGLFCFMFLVSVALTATNAQESSRQAEALGYPGYLAAWPLAVVPWDVVDIR